MDFVPRWRWIELADRRSVPDKMCLLLGVIVSVITRHSSTIVPWPFYRQMATAKSYSLATVLWGAWGNENSWDMSLSRHAYWSVRLSDSLAFSFAVWLRLYSESLLPRFFRIDLCISTTACHFACPYVRLYACLSDYVNPIFVLVYACLYLVCFSVWLSVLICLYICLCRHRARVTWLGSPSLMDLYLSQCLPFKRQVNRSHCVLISSALFLGTKLFRGPKTWDFSPIKRSL